MKKVLIIASSLIIIAAMGSSWLVVNNHHKPKSLPPSSKSSSNQTTKPLTAGGLSVPADSVARARAAGYYCPSWDARPGQATSDICLPLDK